MESAQQVESGAESAVFETFDNFEEIAEEAEMASDDWSVGDGPQDKEEVSEDLKVLDDSQADAEGKVIKDDKKVEKKEAKEEKEEKEEKKEEKDEKQDEEEVVAKADKEEDKKDTKKLRMKMGEDLYNVDPDSTFKVKVDGKTEEVPLQELINNYSGKTAWDKKFTDLGKEKKTFEVERSKFLQEKSNVVTELKSILEPLTKEGGNPIESLMKLVELSGGDPYNAYRRSIEANLQELENLLDMSEVERELYFHKKKDELHADLNKKRQHKLQESEAFNQAIQKVDALRESYKVSEQEFVDAADELESIYEEAGLELDNITEEIIVDYASLRPHIEKVKQLVAPYEENISEGKYGDVVAELSRHLRDGKADEATIQELLKRNYSVDEDVKELNTKVYSKAEKAPAKKTLKQESSKFETFDDWN